MPGHCWRVWSVRRAVREEGSSLDDPGDGLIDALSSLSRTEAVMREKLRMYPSGISIVRSAKQRTSLAGRTVRRGTLVMIPVYAIQRSSQYWERPDEFDPSRHDGERSEVGYLPFGLGPRRCLGARFARTELRIALSRMCSRWELAYTRAHALRPVTAPSLRAEGALPLTIA